MLEIYLKVRTKGRQRTSCSAYMKNGCINFCSASWRNFTWSRGETAVFMRIGKAYNAFWLVSGQPEFVRSIKDHSVIFVGWNKVSLGETPLCLWGETAILMCIGEAYNAFLLVNGQPEFVQAIKDRSVEVVKDKTMLWCPSNLTIPGAMENPRCQSY